MKTASLSWVPIAPVMVGGLEGQLVAFEAMRHTVPVAARTGIATDGRWNSVPRIIIAERAIVVFFTYYTRFSQLHGFYSKNKPAGRHVARTSCVFHW
jgi:hypothetical protein